MICSSLILSALCAYLVRSQNTEGTETQSQSAPATTVAFSSILENILSGEGNATSILSNYSDQISSALESFSSSLSESTSEAVSTAVFGSAYGEPTETSYAYPTEAYPTVVPSESYHQDMPEIICSISCTVDETTTTEGSAQTESISRRSLQDDSGSEADVSNDGSENGLNGSSPVNRPGCMMGGRKGPPLPPGGPNVDRTDDDCGAPGVRPIAPQTPWGWPSNFNSQRSRPYRCYYHAATAPECKNIHDQAVATYCVKSPRPGLCRVRACQVLDQCKSIISSGRGYCWNPKWFSAIE